MRRVVLWVPLAVFAAIPGIVALSLRSPADRTVRSALTGKPLPTFALQPLIAGKPGVTSADFTRGRPKLLNIFASWCIPCIAEAPQLLELRRRGVRIDAIAIHDTAPAVRAFLGRNGDPYAAIGDDRTSRTQLSLGSSGVPETFVIDGGGRVVAQHVGEIRAEDIDALFAQVQGAPR